MLDFEDGYLYEHGLYTTEAEFIDHCCLEQYELEEEVLAFAEFCEGYENYGDLMDKFFPTEKDYYSEIYPNEGGYDEDEIMEKIIAESYGFDSVEEFEAYDPMTEEELEYLIAIEELNMLLTSANNIANSYKLTLQEQIASIDARTDWAIRTNFIIEECGEDYYEHYIEFGEVDPREWGGTVQSFLSLN